MHSADGVAARLGAAVSTVLGAQDLPWRLRAWDGSEAGPSEAPVLVVRSPLALRRLMWAPGELGLARAYVAGDIDLEDDVFDTMDALSALGRLSTAATFPRPSAREWLSMARTGLALGAVGPPPAPPPEEFPRPARVRRHTPGHDAAAVTHHYDVGNDFYALVLGPTLVYSCAVWTDAGTGLDAAQIAKLDLVCRKLGLQPGMRLLDVGCGWGGMAMHAAKHYGVEVVAVTLSRQQAEWGQKAVAQAGLSDLVDIRFQDYRDVPERDFDRISSIGLTEHIGIAKLPSYAHRLASKLAPQGRLLNHCITRPDDHSKAISRRGFIGRYVFPDGELMEVGRTVTAMQAAGFEVRDVESLREHYARTLRAWVANLEANWDACVDEVGEGTARIWGLYMAGSRLGFERNEIQLHHVLATKTDADGESGYPLRHTF